MRFLPDKDKMKALQESLQASIIKNKHTLPIHTNYRNNNCEFKKEESNSFFTISRYLDNKPSNITCDYGQTWKKNYIRNHSLEIFFTRKQRSVMIVQMNAFIRMYNKTIAFIKKSWKEERIYLNVLPVLQIWIHS